MQKVFFKELSFTNMSEVGTQQVRNQHICLRTIQSLEHKRIRLQDLYNAVLLMNYVENNFKRDTTYQISQGSYGCAY